MTARHTGLPPPGAAARAHSARLVARLRGQIGARAISFERFMHEALYAPGLGYYVAGARRFGAGGDFVTAPEVSEHFARCLAAALAPVLEEIGGGDLLEVGAGSGALAVAMLHGLNALDALPERYYVLEPSPDLRACQAERVEREACELAARVRWLDAPPDGLRGVIISNEVADALPVERFRVTAHGLRRIGTAWRDGRLCDVELPAPETLARAVDELQTSLTRRLAQGYESELSLQLGPWCATLADCLRCGAWLLLDYGYPRREYYLPERSRGTLVCHYRHRAHADPYWYPGLQDISAFVDFTRVVEAATGAGLDFEGYTTQSWFLLDTGILAAPAPARGAVFTRAAVREAQQLKTLLLPGEMGERFAVAGFSRGLKRPLAGFTRHLNHRL